MAEFESGLREVGLTGISIIPTHSVADGMVSAIVKATKPAEAPRAVDLTARALPLAQTGCCGGSGCC
jgi:hypothetical protein